MLRTITFLLTVLCLCMSMAAAESEEYKQFKDDYEQLSCRLLNSAGEVTKIKEFVYQKDIATFTFEEGEMGLWRHVDGRPTMAIFVGKGSAAITVPSHLETNSLKAVTGKSSVDEKFEICVIRFSDDFDLRLKEHFAFEEEEMGWRTFNAAKKSQGELFFQPTMFSKYDNYFQLLQSHYERADDGFFFIDFNRYCFTYDPNRPEEVVVSYEFEGGDIIAAEAASLQKIEKNITADSDMSALNYETTTLSQNANLLMGGMDGTHLNGGGATIELLVNHDSLKYVSLFQHYNLKTDSVYYNGAPVDYHRRRDFTFFGVILPEYVYRGDTISFTIWSRGREFDYALPYTDNPAPAPHSFNFTVPKGFNYFMPGMGSVEEGERRTERFTSTPSQPYRRFYFDVCASGYDTIPQVSEIGVTINFLKSKHINKKNFACFIPDEDYRSAAIQAFDFFTGLLGNPGVFGLYVYPESFLSMPGLMELPQVACVTEGPMVAVGGFHNMAGYAAARQWFAALMRPASHREFWLADAVPAYLGGMFVDRQVGAKEFYSGLMARRDTIDSKFKARGRLRPLATGTRVDRLLRTNKGAWIMHMLRFLMLDLETSSDKTFQRFLIDLFRLTNGKLFTNADVQALAEKHYGAPLDWFFDYWLYDTPYPKFDVEYTVEKSGDGYTVSASVSTERVGDDFRIPVIMRVVIDEGETPFVRKEITGTQSSFELGPFESEPKKLLFNEFFGVLCDSNVKKK